MRAVIFFCWPICLLASAVLAHAAPATAPVRVQAQPLAPAPAHHHHHAPPVQHAAVPAHKPVTRVVAPVQQDRLPPPKAETPAVAVPPPAPDKGASSGLPLPRFAALRSDEVNLRSGPGTRYPIDWVYQRRDLPVQIEREFEVWRLIEDPEGTKGWVHKATLTGRRGIVVTGAERVIRASADPKADAVAKLMPGVVGRIIRCDTGAWCQVQVGEYRGWMQRDEFWGSFPGEPIQ